ncbi:MAG: FdhD/NarQ family, partial [Arthrobacter koreensis]|nr:FdhD/NarQ family [Arthrobacter koreensis]
MTLVGFSRGNSLNCYCFPERIQAQVPAAAGS